MIKIKKYAVAVCDLFNSENKIKIVHAKNEIEAVVIAVEIEEENGIEFNTLEEALQYYFDSDLSVSEPVEIG